MILLVDCDPIIYRCGFAVERPEYHLVYESADGSVGYGSFHHDGKRTALEQLTQWKADNPGLTVLDTEVTVHTELLANALAALNLQVNSIEYECLRHYNVSRFHSIVYVLSGKGNYREQIATVMPYKGNRDPDHKPFWYKEMRDYMVKRYGAIVVNGREADDEISIRARALRKAGADYVVATIDKDLDQIPGKHYDYMKKVFYDQSVADAEYWFYIQALTGDPTDGVPGCYRVGPGTASKLLDLRRLPARADMDADATANAAMLWERVCAAYRASTTKKGCIYADRDPDAIALEMARLVKLQEYEGQLWTPPGQPDELLEGYTDV